MFKTQQMITEITQTMGKLAFWSLVYFVSENDWNVATWSLD